MLSIQPEIPPHAAENDARANRGHVGAARVTLPKLNLPTFGGDPKEWMNFKDLFEALVHQNVELSNVQKFQYLKASLKDQPSRLLNPMSTTAQNYEEGWTLLTSRYDVPRLIVSSHLKNIVHPPRCFADQPPSIRKLHDTMEESYRSLQVLKIPVDKWDAILVYITVEQLDQHLLRLWEQEQGLQDMPTFQQMLTFLEKQARIAEYMPSRNKHANGSNAQKRFSKNTVVNQSSTVGFACSFCKEKHSNYKCPVFKAHPYEKRRELVRQLKLCINCLRTGHTNGFSCQNFSCKKCGMRHHPLLHPIGKDAPTDSSNKSSAILTFDDNDVSDKVQTSLSSSMENLESTVMLATAKILLEDSCGNNVNAVALLDSGSQASFMSNKLFKKLQLPKLQGNLSISGVGGTSVQASRGSVKSLLSSRFKDFSEEVTFIILNNITAYSSPQLNCQTPDKIYVSRLADPKWNKPQGIDVLLGADILANVLLPELIPGKPGFPLAQNTKLGWVLFGKCNVGASSHISCQHSNIDADVIMQKFWEMESIPNNGKNLTEAESVCEDHFMRTHYRLPNGRYGARLPFKTTPPGIGNSKSRATMQFISQERKLMKNPSLKKAYVEFMTEYLQLGHMQEVPQNGLNSEAYYMPHHGVFKTNGDTSKIRVVFNASSPTSNGKSLNEELYIGPPVLNDSLAILMRFRCRSVAFVADIEKMYRQVEVHEDDRPFQRILWRPDNDEPIKEFQMTTVTYGMSCAPYCAIRTLQQVAKDYEIMFPQASRCLLEDFYVDDCLSGADSNEGAMEISSELMKLLNKGQFHLRKWASNVPATLNHVPAEDKLAQDSCELLSTTALGVRWELNNDELSIPYVSKPTTEPTKRKVLSEAARLYDQLGMVSAVSIKIKVFMQQLWLTGCNWDDPLPTELLPEWSNLQSDLKLISSVKFPRFVMTSGTLNLQLCGFSDASERAIAATVYVRVWNNEEFHANLLCSKTKVAPLKKQTIPRLELSAALLLAKLMKFCQETMKVPVECMYAWTDSSIVYHWIRATPSKWKAFVENRVIAIQEVLPPGQWHHVASQDNPADLASRGVTVNELKCSDLWWHGPEWLTSSVLPSSTIEPENPLTCTEEMKNQAIHVIMNDEVTTLLDLVNYSSLTRLIRNTCHCFKFINICKRKRDSSPSYLTTNELKDALHYWVRACQKQAFPDVIEALSQKGPLPRKNVLEHFSPFLDDDNLLRVGGRLQESSLPFTVKHPVILPAHHHLTMLIVRHEHEVHCHAGPTITLSALRRKYWILRGRNTIRHIIYKCVTCSRLRKNTPTQKMANLPPSRILPSIPFDVCGIDFAGPLQMRQRKGGRRPAIMKSYIVFFICFSTKAVHLEITSDASLQTLIMAIQRFIARRGTPSKIMSDRGSAFQGAKRYYSPIHATILDRRFPEKLAHLGIEWNMNPAAAPHFGGLWESNIKTSKNMLFRVLGKQILEYEELNTIVTRVESCMNSRPLSALTSNDDDLDPLTPGHFLIGKPLMSPSDEPSTDVKKNLRSRWALHKKLIQQLWDRWTKDYVMSLQMRNKWTDEKPNVKIGDLVLLKTRKTPLLTWPLGRIINTFPGVDGLVRNVQIRTSDGLCWCPLARISALPYNDDVEEPSSSRGQILVRPETEGASSQRT